MPGILVTSEIASLDRFLLPAALQSNNLSSKGILLGVLVTEEGTLVLFLSLCKVLIVFTSSPNLSFYPSGYS